MRIKFLKKLLWAVNTVLVVAIVAVALKFFILDGPRQRGFRPPEEILKGRIPPPMGAMRLKQVDPEDTFRSIWALALSGNPPAEAAPVGPAQPAKHVPPLARDYELLSTKVNLDDPMESEVTLYRKADKQIVLPNVGELVEGVWKLVKVEKDVAVFVEEGGDETVTLEVDRKAVAELGPPPAGGAGGTRTGPIGPGGDGSPSREGPRRNAVEIRENFWDVPREEREWWEAWGEKAAEEEVVVQPVTDEQGRPAGLMLKSVNQGSIIERRGLRRGDILRSINGQPVSSRQEAVNYLKGPGKGLSRYVVEIERAGRVFTITYNVRK